MHNEMSQALDDLAWREDGERNGWALPPKAAWPLRLPIARTIRAAWMDYRASKAASEWATVGIGIGHINPRDRWVIYAVSRGWC